MEFGRNPNLSSAMSAGAYNPHFLWKTTAQPMADCKPSDYVELAAAAQDNLVDQMSGVMDRNKLSHVWISHEDFLKFERSEVPFRKWFDNVCRQRGLNSDVDVCLIGPSLKTLQSAERKSASNSPTPDRVVDYLRCMPVVLKQNPGNRKNRDSLLVLEKLMKAIEGDEGTIAWKNYFFAGHPQTGMRATKPSENAPHMKAFGKISVFLLRLRLSMKPKWNLIG